MHVPDRSASICPMIGAPGEIQIPNTVQNFVANELIVISKTVTVENCVAANNDGIVQGTTERQGQLCEERRLREQSQKCALWQFQF